MWLWHDEVQKWVSSVSLLHHLDFQAEVLLRTENAQTRNLSHRSVMDIDIHTMFQLIGRIDAKIIEK